MAIEILKRVFKHDKIELTDPNPKLSPNEVKRIYSNKYPELITANIDGPEYKDGVSVYKFTTSFKPKG